MGAPELLLIVGALVLLFGTKKLPELARSLGQAKQELHRGMAEGEAESAAASKRPGTV
jgi:sec-independent protein translocase protein TatA